MREGVRVTSSPASRVDRAAGEFQPESPSGIAVASHTNSKGRHRCEAVTSKYQNFVHGLKTALRQSF